MIVCHCNIITKSDISSVVHDFLAQDAWQLITVGMVYHAMKKRGKCCGCFPNAIAVIVDCVEAWHRDNATPETEIIEFVTRTRSMLSEQEAQRSQMRQVRSNRHAA